MSWRDFATPEERRDIISGYDKITAEIEALKKRRDEKYSLSYMRLQQRCSQRKRYEKNKQ